MATIAGQARLPAAGDNGFFLRAAIAMVLVIVAGFSLQLAMGRSSFAAPLLVHAHAFVFMGWVAIYLAQNALVASGNLALHRRLGWLAAVWMVPMLGLGVAVTLALVQGGRVPFFFRPLQFLVFDPLSLFTFVGLSGAAIVLRRRTDWHRRLHFCGMATLLGPGFGRLMPMPLLIPWAFEATFVATLLFPIAGVIADWRRTGRVHPAWGRGIAAMVAMLVAIELVTYSPVGTALYGAITAGTPGAAVAPLAFPLPPRAR
ncbi:hypothetical protein IP88_00215 [alpha proteobacterium AAP81b]|nr:hypothetical protein IP88_00215 [alpha proteobacterium AAP81b]